MMIDYLVEHYWLAILIWEALFLLDYYLTITSVKLHHKYAAEFIRFESTLELNPFIENEVNKLRLFSWKQLFLMLFYGGCLWIFGSLRAAVAFEFFFGFLFWPSLLMNLRHLQNIAFYLNMRRTGSLSGSLTYSYWMSQRNSANLMLANAIILTITALVAGSLFLWGGSASNLIFGLRSYSWANRKIAKHEPAHSKIVGKVEQ